jgi:hypothetical protein
LEEAHAPRYRDRLAAALLGGCQINSPREQVSRRPFSPSGSEDTPAAKDPQSPPYIMSHPMRPCSSTPSTIGRCAPDRPLRQISCHQSRDGALVVSARVQNLGADVIPIREQIYGEVSAFQCWRG